MMAKLRSSSLAVTALVAAMTGIFLWLVFLPTQRAIAAARAELEEKRAYCAQSLGNAAALRRTQAELAEATEFAAEWLNNKAGRTEMTTLYGRIAAAAKGAGVVTTHFTPEARVPYAQMERIPLRLAAAGSFHQSCQLIAALESLPDLIWIDELALHRDSEDEDNVVVEATLVIFANNSGNSE